MRRQLVRPGRPEAGVTLMEVLIAITLLSLLTTGMLMAMRIGLSTFALTDNKLMDNRRVAGAQRILDQQLQGLIPVTATCGPQGGPRFGFFAGAADRMRLVTGFSLQGAWRGQPQILEMFVIPGAEGRGVRLVVNETPYSAPASVGRLCAGIGEAGVPIFPAPQPAPTSFVLADELALCRFSYLVPPANASEQEAWMPVWPRRGWPKAIRVEMTPLDPQPGRLQPISVTVPLHLYRNPETAYVE